MRLQHGLSTPPRLNLFLGKITLTKTLYETNLGLGTEMKTVPASCRRSYRQRSPFRTTTGFLRLAAPKLLKPNVNLC